MHRQGYPAGSSLRRLRADGGGRYTAVAGEARTQWRPTRPRAGGGAGRAEGARATEIAADHTRGPPRRGRCLRACVASNVEIAPRSLLPGPEWGEDVRAKRGAGLPGRARISAAGFLAKRPAVEYAERTGLQDATRRADHWFTRKFTNGPCRDGLQRAGDAKTRKITTYHLRRGDRAAEGAALEMKPGGFIRP